MQSPKVLIIMSEFLCKLPTFICHRKRTFHKNINGYYFEISSSISRCCLEKLQYVIKYYSLKVCLKIWNVTAKCEYSKFSFKFSKAIFIRIYNCHSKNSLCGMGVSYKISKIGIMRISRKVCNRKVLIRHVLKL